MAKRMPVAHQQRSRDTSDRLLTATLRVFEEQGFDGATIPRIAAAAGLSTASIYRRFGDRDSLCRAALLYMLEQAAEKNRANIPPEIFDGVNLETAVASVVSAILRRYRLQPNLLRSLSLFIETDSDKGFRRKASGLMTGNYANLVKSLMRFRRDIIHPDPQRALEFAIAMTVTAAEMRALEKSSIWHRLLNISDEEMEAELTRSFLSYIGRRGVPRRS